MLLEIVWWISVIFIFEAMIGYPITLLLLNKIMKAEDNFKIRGYEPTVTVMVVAHNEEKVIQEKLQNLINIDYPKEKLSILIASDCSTDRTDGKTEDFIREHRDIDITLYKSVNHWGKTNAQNEAQRLVTSEILIMTDANAMLEKNAVRELVSSFSSKDIVYVSGQLKYTNTINNKTAGSEGTYWKIDLKCRDIESKIQTITAGNGALYAVRNEEYVEIKPKECHDSMFPVIYALDGKRAIYNKDAIAYEKAGEIDRDEFKRKVRMNRIILHGILPDIRVLNVIKYRWFTFFYLGHRTCRYLLWLMHLLVLLNSVFLFQKSIFWKFTLILQLLFYVIAIIGWLTNSKNKAIRITTYYCMAILAQWNGMFNVLTGAAKATWEKAESTR